MDGTPIANSGTVRGWLSSPARLDRIEQIAIIALWCLLVARVLQSTNPFAPLLLLSETAVAVFTVIRRPTANISLRLGDWLLAITATAAPLLVTPGETGPAALVPAGVVLVFVGNLFQVWAKLVLRRSFGVAPANRGVKVSGPYKLVRHPMYAGYLLSHIGLMCLMPSLLNAVIYTIAWVAQIQRLKAEERLLAEDPAYRALCDKVRYRLVPGIF